MDTVQIHQHFLKLSKDPLPRLYDAFQEIGPLDERHRQTDNVFHTLCRAVVGQQLSTKAAGSIWDRLIDMCGGEDLCVFLIKTDPDDLRGCGLSYAKVKTLKAIANAFASENLSESILAQKSPQERRDAFTAIWGVGNWTADMVGLFYYRDPDIWPGKDLAVVKTLKILTGHPDDIDEIATLFSPYRSYLAFYMWAIKNNMPVSA